MSNKIKTEPATIARLKKAMKGVDGREESVVVAYINNYTNGNTVGVVGDPTKLTNLWDYILWECDNRKASEGEQMFVHTFLVALAMHYTTDELTAICSKIRQEIDDIEQELKEELN